MMTRDEKETRVLEYLEGELSPEEERQLLADAESDAELKALLAEYRQQEQLLNGYFGVLATKADQLKHPNLASLPVAHEKPRRGGAAKWLAMAAGVALLAATAPLLFDKAESDWGTVMQATGSAKSVSAGKLIALDRNDTLDPAIERIKTSEQSGLEIKLVAGGSLALNENSTLRVSKVGDVPEFVLDRGEVFVRRSPAMIRTPWFQARASDAEFNVVRGLRGAELAVARGNVEILRDGERRTLRAGETWSSTNSTTLPIEQRLAWVSTSTSLPKGVAEQPAPNFVKTEQPPTEQATAMNLAMANFAYMDNNVVQGTTSYLPESTVVLIEIRNVMDLLNSHGGTNDLSDALLGDTLKNKILEMASASQHDPVALAETEQYINNLFGNEDLVSVLASLRGELSIGLTNQGPVVIAEITDNLAEVHRRVDEDFAAILAENNGEGPRFQVAGRYLVAGFVPELLDEVATSISSGTPSGFASSPFLQDLRFAASPEVPLVVGSDIQSMFRKINLTERDRRFLDFMGLNNMRSIIASPRFADDASNRALQVRFDGARQGVMGWLASPGPINGMEFFSADTHALIAARIEYPLTMLEQFVELQLETENSTGEELENSEHYRDLASFASSLGNEVVIGIDNPVLPIPNVKFVIELADPIAFHDGMLKIIEMNHTLDSSSQLIAEATTYRDYMIVDLHKPNSTVGISYAVVDDHAVFGPGKPFLQAAIDSFVDHRSIDLEPAFIEALPAKSGSHVSGLLFVAHNKSMSQAAPLLSELLAVKGMPVDLEAISRTVPNRSLVLYAIAEQDRIDWYLNGVDGEFQMTGIVPAVTEWIASPSN